MFCLTRSDEDLCFIRSDEDSDEIDDRTLNKILIFHETPPAQRKHPGGDRTGDHIPRAKMSADLAKVIDDGLYYYEKDLWEQDIVGTASNILVC